MLWFRTPQKVYFKKGAMPVALNELRDVMGKKKAFIVTDSFLYQNGYTKPITDKLDELGITYTVFSNVQPDPTLANAQEGAKAMSAFQPDTIIALGGGSAMDAGKIMWVMYEHPEVDFQDLAMRFVDIRKRVYTFPHMGESHLLRHRQRGHALCRYYRPGKRREVSPGGLRAAAQYGHRGRGQHDEPAQGADQRQRR